MPTDVDTPLTVTLTPTRRWYEPSGALILAAWLYGTGFATIFGLAIFGIWAGVLGLNIFAIVLCIAINQKTKRIKHRQALAQQIATHICGTYTLADIDRLNQARADDNYTGTTLTHDVPAPIVENPYAKTTWVFSTEEQWDNATLTITKAA